MGALAQPDDVVQRAQLEAALERMSGMIGEAPSRYHHDRAEVLFRLGRFEESVADYDQAAQFGRPHDEDWCWERGLAQYYAGDFAGGRDQFLRYNRVGSLDIENGIWRFLCIAELDGIEKARETMLEYPRKVRPPFPALLEVYLGQGSAVAVMAGAERDATAPTELTTYRFYAHYYLGKYYEISGETATALAEVTKALEYRIPHFMYACAKADARRLRAASSAK